MTEIYICSPRLPTRGVCRKVSFPRSQQSLKSKFLSGDLVDHNHGALTTGPNC